jgi:hypothetical protein
MPTKTRKMGKPPATRASSPRPAAKPKSRGKTTVPHCVRNRDSFVSEVERYLERTGMTLTSLGTAALGTHSSLSRCFSQPGYRVTLDVVDRVLTYMETNK